MTEEKTCIHCGADCGNHLVKWNEQPFCCQGCKQVYQLLHEHKMGQYYSYYQQPGIRIDEPAHQSKYAFLDRADVQEKLFEFRENDLARVSFYIPSIHCASCIWLLEHLNKLHKGIVYSMVNFVKKEITITFNTSDISLRRLVELLVSIHYIPDISLKTIGKKDLTATDRKLVFKIGVAGFVFGNVMLYSLPEYFSGKTLEGNLNLFLSYMSFLLAIPVVFFSGSDYLVSAWKNIRRGIVNIDLPIAMGILALFLVTAWQVFTQSGQGYSDSLSGFLFFMLVGRWFQSRTYQSMAFDRDYTSYFPVAVARLNTDNGNEESILLEEIKVGDRLLIRNRELIPADSILLDGLAMIDYSFVSGESVAVQKKAGDFLYAGGIQTTGAITIRVEKEVKQSHLTRLWNQGENKDKKKESFVPIIDRISVWFTLAVIFIALGGLLWWWARHDVGKAIMVFTSVLIVACPCALALTLPFSFGNAMRILGSKGLYLKNTGVLERLLHIDTLVFDKTGTLTKPDQSVVSYEGEALKPYMLQAVVSLSRQSTHPLSLSLSKQYEAIRPLPAEGFTEMPGRGIFGRVDGHEVRIGSLAFVGANEKSSEDQTAAIYVSIDKEIKGFFRVSNRYREGMAELIASLQKEFDLYLLSGDNAAEKKNLEKYFHPSHLHFNQQPADKMNFIEALQNRGKKVLMTGDGLNDAGAFLKSDLALSVADNVFHFSPASDAIIDSEKFGALARYMAYARKTLVVVKISFVISILYNFAGLSFALSGNLSPVVAAILMPLSSLTVVAFTTAGTRWLANRMLG
ncbi:MAG: heavy metal translocating P-type ATPase metal-binding domain-containing protein [Bacteroidota bacterium]|nr:MAG: heavy metal translocating P-type ATPase metal-binding domain-containing protein [Bacteroidota bacterium]